MLFTTVNKYNKIERIKITLNKYNHEMSVKNLNNGRLQLRFWFPKKQSLMLTGNLVKIAVQFGLSRNKNKSHK